MAQQHKAGIASVGQYQTSGTPYLTGSTLAGGAEQSLTFPFLAKAITVYNTGGQALRVHFDSKVSNANVYGEKHYLTVPAAAAGNSLNRLRLDVRCKTIYLSSPSGTTYEVMAEMTRIPDNFNLSGSGINVI